MLQPAVLLVVSMAATALAIAWGRSGTPHPGRPAFVLGLVGTLWWTGTTLAQVLAPTPEGKILASKLAWAGSVTAPIAWTLSIRAYVGVAAAPGVRGLAAVLAFALIVVAAALTTETHRGIYSGYDIVVDAEGFVTVLYRHGALFWSVVGVLHVALLVGVATALRAAGVNAAVYRRQFLGLVVAMVLPWGFNLAGLGAGFLLWGVDPEPFAFTMTGLVLALLMRDGGLFRLAPIAHRVVLEIIPDPVIVLDANRRIVEANPAAERLLRLGGAATIGRPLIGPASLARHLDGLADTATTSDVDVPELDRAFEVASEPLAPWGRPGGRLLVLRDITARRAAESRLAAATAALTERLAQNLDLQRRLEAEAQRDHLTGLFNRRHAHAVAPDLLARALAERRPLAVLIIDLDHFKSFNDRFGHQTGDTALQVFAEVLRRDLGGEELGFRWGGEEFLVLLPGSDRGKALERCRLWRARLAATPIAAAEGRALTFSAGVAVAPEAGEALADLVRAADVALYRAKVTGRDRALAWSGGADALTAAAQDQPSRAAS